MSRLCTPLNLAALLVACFIRGERVRGRAGTEEEEEEERASQQRNFLDPPLLAFGSNVI
jgi:hypothetical protein